MKLCPAGIHGLETPYPLNSGTPVFLLMVYLAVVMFCLQVTFLGLQSTPIECLFRPYGWNPSIVVLMTRLLSSLALLKTYFRDSQAMTLRHLML